MTIQGISANSTRPIRIGIVDDSSTFVGLIGAAFKSKPEFQVCGTAADTFQAKKLLHDQKPDVLTLDIALPGQNGLDFLLELMQRTPIPVIMVSSLTSNGAEISIEALKRGAVACVLKPLGRDQLPIFHADLRAHVRYAAQAKVSKTGQFVRRDTVRRKPKKIVDIIGVAASTGGIKSLDYMFKSLPRDAPPIVITQHLQPAFMEKLANRMREEHKFDVSLAKESEKLDHGAVRFAAPNCHLLPKKSGNSVVCEFMLGSAKDIIRPAADYMFNSISKEFGANSIGIVLSGMGNDGAVGLLDMKKKGALCLGEAAETCTVYGMPKRAKEVGAIELEKPVTEIGNFISEVLGYVRANR